MDIQFVASIAGIAAIGGMIVAILSGAVTNLFRAALDYGFDWLFPRMSSDNYDSTELVLDYLREHAKHLTSTRLSYGTKTRYVIPIAGETTVFTKEVGFQTTLFLYKGAIIWLKAGGRLKDGDNGEQHYTFRSLRGTVNWDALFREVSIFSHKLDQKISEKSDELFRSTGYAVYYRSGGLGDLLTAKNKHSDDGVPPGMPGSSNRYLQHPPMFGWKEEEIGFNVTTPTEHLSIGPEAQKVIDQINFWSRNADWYEERNIPWRRGFMLYGAPGNGKTSLVRYIGQRLDCDVFVFDLSTMTNYDFCKHWDEAVSAIGIKIILFEDFDSVFNLRQNRASHDSALSFDCLLNRLDGIESHNGVLLFITTNHIECIDPALGVPGDNGIASRPGRIDCTVEVPAINYEGRLKMAKRILKNDQQAEEMASTYDQDTTAQFQERLIQTALNELWSPK